MTPVVSFEPLTPTAHLLRAARVHGDRLAVVDGERRYDYAEMLARCERLAGALVALGVEPGDRVAVLAPNTHVMLEAHYGVPWSGGVLLALNVRLTAAELAGIVDHAGATVLIADPGLLPLAAEVVAQTSGPLRVVDGGDEYERLLAAAEPLRRPVEDERSLLALNYTSGTTGRPKGVMYHHRGAYLQSLAMLHHSGLRPGDAYLWTLPMFHCNGWCFTWAVTAAGATHVCLPKVDAGRIWTLLREAGVTHFCAAPTVLSSLVDHPDAGRLDLPDPDRGPDDDPGAGPWNEVGGRPATRPVWVAVGGAPPSPALLERATVLGLEITHLYGLTETFGPVVINQWRSAWDALPEDEQAVLRARQGVGNVISEAVRIVDPDGRDLPADGVSLGEVALRGNNLMLGYYRDEQATRTAVPDGWFRTGDLGVLHPDGYLELRDRAKDVIVSGGENIASVEVEAVIAGHPAVAEVAVFAVPHDHWGERPVALVSLRPGTTATADEIRAHARGRLPGFKVPDAVTFGELPKNATGKVQKHVLRAQAWEGAGRRIG